MARSMKEPDARTAERLDTYAANGGKIPDTEGRGCLCNGLMANIELDQRQAWGDESPLIPLETI